MTDDLEVTRHVLQLLGHVLADLAQLAAALAAGAWRIGRVTLGVVDPRLARQVLRQLALSAARLARLRLGRLRGGGLAGLRGFGRNERQLRVELFAGTPILLAHAACQLKLELVDHQLEQRHLGVALGNDAQQRLDGQGRVG